MLTSRWNSNLGDISLVLAAQGELLSDIETDRKRGRPLKRSLTLYIAVIIVKEMKRASLRNAETDWSITVCGERIDHSMIAYREKRIPGEVIARLAKLVGERLESLLGYDFSVIDGTSFADWYKETTGFHLLNRIANGTVYPVNMHPDSLDPVPDTTGNNSAWSRLLHGRQMV